MTVEILQTMSLIFYIAAAVIFLISIALFFVFDIPKIYGDITGKTAKRAIEEIRIQNEKNGEDKYASSKINRERGRLTDKISPSGRLHHNMGVIAGASETEKLAIANSHKGSNEETTVLSNETTILSNETTILSNETTVLSNETTVLDMSESQQTGRLSDNPMIFNEPEVQLSVDEMVFKKVYELGFTGSNELIE